jgi:hypothetical protein
VSALLVAGTTSHAGKTGVTTGPNNSMLWLDQNGRIGEIGRAQCDALLALAQNGVPPDLPVLPPAPRQLPGS